MGDDPAGLLLIDKTEGPTSHDVVALLRRAIGVRRIGHTGTLDPFASGLLLACVGWVTRLAEYLTGLPKAYVGVIRLGVSTDTDDRTGCVVQTSSGWQVLDRARVQAALERQLGPIEQVPPAYSAKQLGGRRAYAVARAGARPELPSQRVTIHRLAIRDYSPPDVTVELECSSGTYVRAVARDLGASLGVGAHLTALRRLRVGVFTVDDALGLTRDSQREDILERLLPPEAAVAHLERVDLDHASVRDLAQGRPVAWRSGRAAGPVAVHDAGRLTAVAGVRDERLWPIKVFADAGEQKARRD